jgi:hypothetical protein
MSFLKKAVLALSLSFAMLSVAPTAIAKPAGKIENQSASETAEATLELLKSAPVYEKKSVESKAMLASFKETKRIAKTNESATTYAKREKALGKLGKARKYFKKGQQEKSVVEMENAVSIFKEIKVSYHDFM